MHRVFIKGVRSLEDKFDKEKADWIAQRVATIRFDDAPLTAAAAYDKTVGWILTDEEYRGLTEGKLLMLSGPQKAAIERAAQAIINALKVEEKINE